MKRLSPQRFVIRLMVAMGLVVGMLTPALAASAEDNTQPVGRPDTRPYIVSVAEGSSVDDVAMTYVVNRGGTVTQRYSSALNGFAAELTDEEVAQLRANPQVTSVMEDPVIYAIAQTTPNGVKRIFGPESAIANINGSDERVNVDVAVLDTGSGPHPDLNIAGGKDCTGGSNYSDGNGHGTHVAGTIGALDNSIGVVGVAPGARIWSVKVLDSQGSGYGSWLICGIDWVTANSATIEVANMSLGGVGYPDDNNCGYTNGDTIHQAICRAVSAGVTWAVAAGNDGKDAKGYFPASYNEVITVSALNDQDGAVGNDVLASFSNFGQDVDVIAPGVAILSSVPGGGYESWNGTSMATPHVSGAAALYKVQNPNATPSQVANALKAAGSTSSWTGDKDNYKEPLIDVSTFDGSGGGGGTTTDAQVVSVTAPASANRGQTVTVSAQIKNNSSSSKGIAVAFNEAPGGASQKKTVNIVAGGVSTVSFSWTTSSGTALGNHTFTITTTLSGDTNSANDIGSATTNITNSGGGGGGSTMSVSAMTLTKSNVSGGYRLNGRVTVKSGTAAVRSARVTVQITYPNGSKLSMSATTNSSGTATLTRKVTSKGTYTMTVTGVTKSGMSYNAGGNTISSVSFTIS